jgi:hypothetical protein
LDTRRPSTGGPGDQFEFEVAPDAASLRAIRYRFLDWFDGAVIDLRGDAYDVVVVTATASCPGPLAPF